MRGFCSRLITGFIYYIIFDSVVTMYSFAGETSVQQKFFVCSTCSPADDNGVCASCAKSVALCFSLFFFYLDLPQYALAQCHAGHKLEERDVLAYCDCGTPGLPFQAPSGCTIQSLAGAEDGVLPGVDEAAAALEAAALD